MTTAVDHGQRGYRVSAWLYARQCCDEYLALRGQEIRAARDAGGTPTLDWVPSTNLVGLACRAREALDHYLATCRRRLRLWCPCASVLPARDHRGLTCVPCAFGNE